MFIILMAACVLFGALMFTYSQSSGVSKNVASKGDVKIAANEIHSYANDVRIAVARLMNEGCGERDLRFYHPSFFIGAFHYSGQAEWGNTALNQCHIFDPKNPLSTSFKIPPKLVLDSGVIDYAFTGARELKGIGTYGGCVQSSYELMLKLKVPRELCVEYNKKSGIENPSGEPPIGERGFVYTGNDHIFHTKFGQGGNYYGCGDTIGAGTPNVESLIAGKMSGCIGSSVNPGHYELWEILLPR